MTLPSENESVWKWKFIDLQLLIVEHTVPPLVSKLLESRQGMTVQDLSFLAC